MVTNAFTYSTFYYSIFPQLYHVDTLGCQKEHNSDFKAMNVENRAKNIDEERKEEYKTHNLNKYIEWSQDGTSSARRLGIDEEEKFKKSLINRAIVNMQNRRSYNYTNSDVLYSIWWCVKTKKWF